MNGCTVDLILYTGKNHGAPGKGLASDMVEQLVNEDYLGGDIVYFDHFYTCPPLFRHLSQQGFGAGGILQAVHGQCPNNAGESPGCKRGSIRWLGDEDLLFVKWKDAREVSMCTTVLPVYAEETDNGSYETLPVPRPTAVSGHF